MKTSMGATEMLVGLTEKAMLLEQGMRAAFHELITESTSEGVFAEAGMLKALKVRFDGLWKRAGVRRTLLLDGILGVLNEDPHTAEQIFEFLRGEPEFQSLDQKHVNTALKTLMHADLITADERKMWVQS